MAIDQSELVSVRLGSGRAYLIPLALLVRFVLSAPDAALNLIQGAEVPGGSLDPSGLPSEAPDWMTQERGVKENY